MTLAVPHAGLLALAAEQLVANLGGLRKRGPHNSPVPILHGSPTSVPSFIISPQSEIFFDLAAGLTGAV